MTPDNAHAPAPTFTRARLRWYATAAGIAAAALLYTVIAQGLM